MKIQVQFFARARDLAGGSSATVELPDGATVATLRATLADTYPALRGMAPQLFIAVNRDYGADDAVIRPDDEIACFPPVSGG